MAAAASQWIVFNRTTQFTESTLPNKDAADEHLQYLLEHGAVAEELVLIEVPAPS